MCMAFNALILYICNIKNKLYYRYMCLPVFLGLSVNQYILSSNVVLSVHLKHLVFLSPLLCRQVMSAPNLLRIGTPENTFVECKDCTEDNDIRVEIRLMNYPTKTKDPNMK